jgi:hypothetical protein
MAEKVMGATLSYNLQPDNFALLKRFAIIAPVRD